MNIIMARPKSFAAFKARQRFICGLGIETFSTARLVDPDFDNDNDIYPPTGEPLDWVNCRRATRLT